MSFVESTDDSDSTPQSQFHHSVLPNTSRLSITLAPPSATLARHPNRQQPRLFAPSSPPSNGILMCGSQQRAAARVSSRWPWQ